MAQANTLQAAFANLAKVAILQLSNQFKSSKISQFQTVALAFESLQGSVNAMVMALQAIPPLPTNGLTVTITTAKLTSGGTQGSMTFTNGILTAQVAAT